MDAAPLLPRGSSRYPNARKISPTIAMPAPTGVKSNMPKGSPVSSWRTRETMMLGEVPISVTMPPSSAANDIGISSADTGRSCRRASWNATGIIIASAPMFFTTAESTMTVPASATTCVDVCFRYGLIGRMMRSITPERATAALTISALATMKMMSSLKPENALS